VLQVQQASTGLAEPVKGTAAGRRGCWISVHRCADRVLDRV